ncbi:MAG: hypothetical protein R2764_11290 [Bacteroidales bacterium]
MVTIIRKYLLFSIFALIYFGSSQLNGQTVEDLSKPSKIKIDSIIVHFDPIIVQHIPSELKIEIFSKNMEPGENLELSLNDSSFITAYNEGGVILTHTFHTKEELTISAGEKSFTKLITPIPLWMSVLPPLIAILIALLLREVFSALFIGLLVGSSIITYYQGSSFLAAIFYGLFSVLDHYILESLANPDHLSIIVFSMLIGAMVALISANGGMQGVVNFLSRYANNSKSDNL